MAGKLGNEYSRALGQLFELTPKAVFAAIAYSYATRITEEQPGAAVAEFLNEWRVLHQQGIVPQKPPAETPDGR